MDNAIIQLEHYRISTKYHVWRQVKIIYLNMLLEEIYYKFTSPENEAPVKLYTDGLKESLGIEPKLSYPKTSLGSHYPMKNILTQFNLHSLVKQNIYPIK